jgi:molybdopterin converting factor small subunit
MIAVNSAYAEDDVSIAETDEIALIPPVSGG